ncbi:MAG: RagB/SusD family nutrient uptake outer membrane protein [Muribaculaceae bacterium]|nr:RagB/SusD family nutrient uptake outer membrane protein [Muribaculaceae bacterium]
MKKKYLSIIAGAAVMLSSCDMDTVQQGVIDDTEPLNFEYATNMRNNVVYSNLRSMSVGAWVYNTELQLDQFIGMSNNGGRGGNIANGFLNSSNSEFSSPYQSCYSVISRCNYLLPKCEELLGKVNESQARELRKYIAETKFTRAYAYFYLLDHYCNTNDAQTNGENSLGLQIVTFYEPTGDTSKYPGRSSLKASIEFIEQDLKDAFDGLVEYETTVSAGMCVAGAEYLSSYAVAALQARMALAIGDYTAAMEKSQYVIGNTAYKLATLEGYVNMWHDANVDELIFAPYVDAKEISNQQSFSTCQGYNYWWADPAQCDYIPTQESVYSLIEYEDSEGYINDVRFVAFLGGEPYVLNVEGGQSKTYVFQKYPGNPLLDTGTPMYDNTPKPFRLSEQYLILAEAGILSGKQTEAQKAINALVKARMISPADQPEITLTGSELLAFIRSERSKELMGEGFRLSDLRRWQQGFDRNQPYTLNPDVAQTRSINGLNVVYTNDDFRFVWAIPQAEMDINPHLKGQQNPGYGY